MRTVDTLAGQPACFALTVLRKLGDLLRFGRKPPTQDIKRVLFVKMAEQGATVLAYPAIHKAVEMVGRENVYFLVLEENRFILDVMNVIPEGNVIAIPADGLTTVLWGALRAVFRMRKLRLDAAVDLEFFARSSAALTYLSGAKIRVGLHGFGDKAPYRGDLMTHRLEYDPGLHTTLAFRAMVEAVDLAAEDLPRAADDLPAVREKIPASQELPPMFFPDEKEVTHVRAVLGDLAGTDDFRPLVLLNANASDLLPLRRWASGKYVEVARRLLDRSEEVRVAFTGAPKEADAADGLVEAVDSDRCFSMAGKTTLRELLVLYTLADVLVTNDSGPAHFATLTPIHVITLFGPETPDLFGARTPRAHIIWKGLECSPCVNAYNNRLSTCTDNRCMQKITVDEVYEQVCHILHL
jgi:ADP-heptose:LPS heptosyltransferase